MLAMLPPSRPKMSESEARKILRQAGVTDPVAVIGRRGYYLQTMGNPTSNDRGIYDDALIVVTPDGIMTFNGNVDPSVFRPGIATLASGVHRYRPGRHGISRDRPGRIVSYPAFRPATKNEQLPVTRDGVASNPRPGVAINIHRGSRNGTSSEGCQTIPPDQWDAFHALVMSALKKAGQKDFAYVLD
jgi:lysozyme